MKNLLSLVGLLLVADVLSAADSVSVPWAEFKRVYRESIEKEILQTQVEPPKPKAPLVYTIEEAGYRLSIAKDSAQGETLITGKIVTGAPAPIPLFGGDIIIAKIKQIVGGSLLSEHNGSRGIFFLPDGKKTGFQVGLSFLVRSQEDSRSRLVSFAVPPALKNSLSLNLSPETSLVEEPGLADADGVYHFSAAASLNVRFLDKQGVSATSLLDIDTFSRIRLQGKRVMITTTFIPVQAPAGSFRLQVQQDAQYVSSSLKASRIKKRDDNSFEIKIPPDEKGFFSIQLAVEESEPTNGITFRLPRIQDNNGKEGDFVIEEPDDGQITLMGQGLVSDIPIARLGKELTQAAGNDRFYQHIPPNEALRLNITRFNPIDAAPVVLDAQYVFTSFEENGSALSVITMDIPPEIGPRLKLKSIPDAEIWSLTVNGQKRKVYINDDNAWIIPLADGEISRVQLALIRKADNLGLQGRLEILMPETGLPARNMRVGIALPERVQLLSIEGPVSPDAGKAWPVPTDFVGKPYFFSCSFYKGMGMKLAVSYKEPVKQ